MHGSGPTHVEIETLLSAYSIFDIVHSTTKAIWDCYK